MQLLENEQLQRMVDYSFGDQSGVLGGIPNAYMKPATPRNLEFFNEVRLLQKEIITLFIDNIRLYKRPIEYSDWLHMKPISVQDREWLKQFEEEDLLELCSRIPHQKFVIFTAFEDTPLDNYIWDKIPHNVMSINAANGVIFGGKVHPFPHGIERKMYEGYDHHQTLLDYVSEPLPYPTESAKLLFVCHRDDTGDRGVVKDLFRDKDWATVTSLPYDDYLIEMSKHKFVLCPSGNGIGSSRNWETLYMRRVPVMEDHPYKRELFKDLPVLFVKDYTEITEELLHSNEHMFEKAQNLDIEKLDLDYWFNKALQ